MAFDQERTGTWNAYSPASQTDPNAGDGPRFTDRLAARFPEVAASIEHDELGVLNLEVDALKLATRAAILKRDWTTVSAHLAFVDELLQTPDPALHEAIGVSYLVNLFYGETSPDFAMARTKMPRRLAGALEVMERHYEEL